MGALVSFEVNGSVAWIVMDDGKVNALSLAMQREVSTALDEAEQDGLVVVLTGRDGIFSAGFDLGVLQAGGDEARSMLRSGFELALRMLSFPAPIVIACTGHAIAMGAFLLLSADYRIGAAGSFKIMANEVALGLTMPSAAMEICRYRLNPAHFTRAVLLSEVYTPRTALEAGFLDGVAPGEELRTAAAEAAARMATLDRAAHKASKLRARSATLDTIAAGIDAEFPPHVH